MAIMQAFKIRVDDKDDVYADRLKVFIGRFNCHLLVQEQEPKIHYHMYLTTDITHAGVRARLKESIPTLEGNKSYAIASKHHDWQGYIGYCLKQPTTKIISHQGLDLTLDSYKEYYETQVQEAESIKKKRKDEDRKNPVWETIAQHLTQVLPSLPDDDMFKAELHMWGEETTDEPPPYFRNHVHHCYEETMKFLIDSGRELQNYKIQGYVENYLNRSVPYYRMRTVRRLARRTLL